MPAQQQQHQWLLLLLLAMCWPMAAVGRLVPSNAKSPFNFTWPTKKAADVEGELTLGGLMMVHERQDDITCGPIMPQGGIQVCIYQSAAHNPPCQMTSYVCCSLSFCVIQALETMLYTIDKINPLLKESSGFTIGAHILDDCDKDTYGLEQAVAFIKGT